MYAKTIILSLIPTAIFILVSCQNQTATSKMNTKNGFAIYLMANDITPQDWETLNHLPLQKEPIITINDIVSYKATTYEIELTLNGYEKIHKLIVPTTGKAFAVCVNGEFIYGGAFWPGYSSQIFDGIIIDPIFVTKDHPVIQVLLGYPGPSFYKGKDPRSDPKIIQSFTEVGKLK